jgi:hypothetical protein
MNQLKRLEKFSLNFIDKKRYNKIRRIKDSEEKLKVFQHSLISFLRLKHIEAELKLKKIHNKKEAKLILLKLNIIPSKINLLQTHFNEKDFKKIDFLLSQLEMGIANV